MDSSSVDVDADVTAADSRNLSRVISSSESNVPQNRGNAWIFTRN